MIVLIIDDEEGFARNTARYLEKSGHQPLVALTATEGMALFEHQSPDIVLLDYALPDGDGLQLIPRLRQADPTLPIIMITGHGSIELAVEAMQLGASDLVTKPVGLADLCQRIGRYGERQRQSGRLRHFEAAQRRKETPLIGHSPCMEDLRQRIARMAELDVPSPPPVLIQGETGCGKELVARALHFDGPRAGQPFIELNCAAIPETMLEAELFGHERGAFTDARERKIGLLEAADGGTLFLDEIGEMSLALQAKLLKVIEDGRFRRLGSVQERQINLRIIAATHRDLEALIADNRFRADLYFRLRVLQLQVPPLRERGEDILVLARHFLGLFAQRYGKPALHLAADAETRLLMHHWPGNVRELRNVMEQAALLCPDTRITVADLMLPRPAEPAGTPAAPSPNSGLSRLEQMERTLLVRALNDAAGNVSGAARQLGISRDTLRYRMEKYTLRPDGGERGENG